MAKKEAQQQVVIAPPKLQTAEFTIIGTAPYVQQAFSEKAKNEMKQKQMAGSQANSKKERKPKDFEECYQNCLHTSREGWYGIPAGAFRAGMVSACRLVGYKMTLAKMSIFVEADGFDAKDGTPLIKITKGTPRACEHMVRIKQTTDVRVRAMWDEGWAAKVRIRFDTDQFSVRDVSNLLMRVGIQVGLGEGRPDSKDSVGMGWGTFMFEEKQ